MANITSRKRATLAATIVAIAIAVVAFMTYSAFAVSARADYYDYALNEENWTMAEENNWAMNHSAASIHTVTISANGYAFQRIDEETLKQLKAETQLLVTIRPEGEGTPRVNITGTVKVDDEIYTIESGSAVLGTRRHVLLIKCDGVDEEGNKITLKLGAVCFWWGGKTYALRSKALLQTIEKPMLLLQKGVAKIQ